MPRLIAVHRLTLKDGVTAEQFESFVRNEYKVLDLSRWRFSIGQGDREKDMGTFVEILETDVATRGRDYPGSTGQTSEEAKAANERVNNSPERKRLDERWDALVAQPTAFTRNYTDYVVIPE